MFNKVKAKEASISIEVSLSVLLASAVLIIALGLFSENLKAMALNNNMTQYFLKGNRAKTANTYMDTNAVNNKVTVAQLPAAQNVGTVGDQGQTLESVHSSAQAMIESLAKAPQPLTMTQKINLAEALTKFGLSGSGKDFAPQVLAGGSVIVNGQSVPYTQLMSDNGINIYYTDFTTTVDGAPKDYSWDYANQYSYATKDPNADPKIKLANLDIIHSRFN